MLDFKVEWDTTYSQGKIFSQGWMVTETTEYYVVSHGTFDEKSDADELLKRLQGQAREYLLKQAREADDPKEPFKFDVGDRVFWWGSESRRYFGTVTGRRRGYSPRGGFREFIYYTVKTDMSDVTWESNPNGSELHPADELPPGIVAARAQRRLGLNTRNHKER